MWKITLVIFFIGTLGLLPDSLGDTFEGCEDLRNCDMQDTAFDTSIGTETKLPKCLSFEPGESLAGGTGKTVEPKPKEATR